MVALVVADSVADTEQDTSEAAHAVAQRMRATMPHCPVQAVTGTGESYAAAYPGMELARRDGDFLIDSPPAPPEVILAKPCDQCRSAAAALTGVAIVASKEADLGPVRGMCQERFEAAGRDEGRPATPFPAAGAADEGRRWRQAGMEVTGFPDDFKARWPRRASTTRTTPRRSWP